MSDSYQTQHARFNRRVGLGFNLDNVAILKKQHLDVPSYVQVILYIPFNDHVKEAGPKLVDRLRSTGFFLNLKAITRASS